MTKYTAQAIKTMLAAKYSSGNGFAFFPEFRTLTGYAHARFIDAVAVGLWAKNNGIWAFEIKINRNDFMRDANQFEHKHADALDISSRFFYVCPWGLIEKGEVPDIAGLLWINKNGGFVTKKQAQLRMKQSIPMHHFLAFAKEFGATLDHSKIPVKYLGEEIGQKEFLQIVEKDRERKIDWAADRKAEKLIGKRNEADEKNRQLLNQIKTILCLWGEAVADEIIEKIQDYKEKAKLLENGARAMESAVVFLNQAAAKIRIISMPPVGHKKGDKEK